MFSHSPERLPMCGNCRSPNVGHVPCGVILETDEELDVEGDEEESESIAGLHNRINEYRWESQHLDTHYEGSSFGTRYLTELTLPLGLPITCCFGTLLACFPTAPCPWCSGIANRTDQGGSSGRVQTIIFTIHLTRRLMSLLQFGSDCFFPEE